MHGNVSRINQKMKKGQLDFGIDYNHKTYDKKMEDGKKEKRFCHIFIFRL
jgi:hypothetical protein